MTELKDLCITTEYSIMNAIKVLDQTHERIVLIVDEGKLLGVVTDSNIRKAILAGVDMKSPVTGIMTSNPVCVTPKNRGKALRLMSERGLDAIPVIEEDGMLVDIVFRYSDYTQKKAQGEKTDAPVVIMAGGKGTRLAPLTDVLPKPLISIGAKTILERILDSFSQFGCNTFFLSVNYKKNLIKAFMEDLGAPFDIQYVEETDFFGTAGSLALLKGKLTDSFFVSNCDILLDVDYVKVMDFHKNSGNCITMLTSLKEYEIPYGIVKLEEGKETAAVKGLEEKPNLDFLVNTGVYVLNPEVLELIPENTFFHITDLIKKCIDEGRRVGAFPITDNAWRDMGERVLMEQMINEYK